MVNDRPIELSYVWKSLVNMETKRDKMITINKDLLREREQCTFDPIELTYLLDGGPKRTQIRRERGENFFPF